MTLPLRAATAPPTAKATARATAQIHDPRSAGAAATSIASPGGRPSRPRSRSSTDTRGTSISSRTAPQTAARSGRSGRSGVSGASGASESAGGSGCSRPTASKGGVTSGRELTAYAIGGSSVATLAWHCVQRRRCCSSDIDVTASAWPRTQARRSSGRTWRVLMTRLLPAGSPAGAPSRGGPAS